VDGLLSELDEYAVEQALQISENSDDDVEITVLTVGPEDAKDALRKALSMGADKAIHVEDDDLHGTDAIGTSLVLAKAIEKAGYDLVISGLASTDGTMGVVPALHSAGRTDIGLVSFGDFPMADSLRPAVTVVDHPGHEVGRVAAARLLARLNQPGLPVERIGVPARLIERGSGEQRP